VKPSREMPAGEPVVIRQYQPEDAEPIFEAATESIEQIFPWMPWCRPGYSREDSRGWVEHCVAAWKSKTEFSFAIVDQANRFLGGCGLNQFRLDHKVANLGYWVRTSATGRGVASKAVRKLIEFAFRETNVIRLEIVVALGNVASHRVAEKTGAVREGIAHDRLFLHGKSHDAVVHALLRSRHWPRLANA
jgi:ribosomal-protein-serine acetyltransferase